VSPAQEYSQRLAERKTRLSVLDNLNARIGSIRLGIGASFLVIAWMCFGPWTVARAWLCLPVAAFIAALIVHHRVRTRRVQVLRAAALYEDGLARMQDQWRGKGETGRRFELPHHIYADDLDLFGDGSLYQLLCACRTQMGENALAQWLRTPAVIEVIHARHAAIADLRDRLTLRESLGVEGDSPRIELHPDALTTWGAAPNRLKGWWMRLVALALALLGIAALVAWAVWGLLYPLLAVILIDASVASVLRKPIRAAIVTVESAFEDLKGLSVLFRRIESESFQAPALKALQLDMSSHSLPASAAIARLATIVNFVEARRNPILAPFLLLLMYPLQAALAAETWRTMHGAGIGTWLKALGEFEALNSLARYAYEHPDDPFPDFVEGAPAFNAVQLGHPLIPAAVRVCNDIDLGGQTRVLLVSGSNMSGKSTLLRTIGINTVLAMAGAPVRARSLQLTPLQVGASIRINDSLHEGSSRFYAEITRLRQLFEPMPLPLLYLLDELLQGTNSADRRVGAQGLIRALIKRGAIGLISTHDLALTDIDGLAPDAIENVHFQDELLDGALHFDFKLHPGVVTKSNGLELMRSIGLDV
jgi:hypothetical protein